MDRAGIAGMRLSVVGAGVSGKGLALFAKRRGAQVFVSDQKAMAPETKKAFDEAGIFWEEGHSDRLLQADRILLSSGIPPSSEAVGLAERAGVSLTGELDFLAPYLSGRGIGITGSNGKSTTTTLLGHLLQKTGRQVAVAGNIGLSLADIAEKSFDWIVMELSSFQLARAHRFPLSYAVVTNLDPDHIDWHGSYEEYVSAKFRIAEGLAGDGCLVMQRRERHLRPENLVSKILELDWRDDGTDGIYPDAEGASLQLSGKRFPLYCREELRLLGRHNQENAAMAMAIVHLLGERVDLLRPHLQSYEPLPHRCAFVGAWNDVLFVDDSKGTNVAAAVTALRSLERRKIVLLGGRGKGENYAPLVDAVKEQADFAVLFGEERERIAEALRAGGFSSFALVPEMESAIRFAVEKARPGTTVLLSPACTSWDAYANYGERGEHFARLAREIAGGKK